MSSLKYLSRLEDSVLGIFSRGPTPETLDHAARYLSTWNGSDKAFMVLQYVIKLLVPFLRLRARVQHRSGKSKNIEATSPAEAALLKLYEKISDSRMLWRFLGLLPIYQWLTSLERTSPPTRNLLTIERLQGWSMLFYYPLEHLYYLRTHDIIPFSVALRLPFARKPMSIELNATKLALWSTRAWAVYLVLQFYHLREDFLLWKAQQKALLRVKDPSIEYDTEKRNLSQRWDAMLNELIGSMANLPLAVHWSLENGVFKNDIWVTLFNLAAALTSFRAGWRATALQSPFPSLEPTSSTPSQETSAAPIQIIDANKRDDKKGRLEAVEKAET